MSNVTSKYINIYKEGQSRASLSRASTVIYSGHCHQYLYSRFNKVTVSIIYTNPITP